MLSVLRLLLRQATRGDLELERIEVARERNRRHPDPGHAHGPDGVAEVALGLALVVLLGLWLRRKIAGR